MTLQSVLAGPIFPMIFAGNPRLTHAFALTSVGTMDAAAEKVAFVGYVHWEDGSTHTMGSSSKIHYKTGACTFADAGTTLRIGIQDVLGSGSGATLLQPDGTFDVYRDLAGNGGGLSSSAANSVTLSTSGSKSVGHGLLYAVVFDMTARGGSDSVIIQGLNSATSWYPPGALANTGSWATVGATPNVLLEADDGAFGILAGIPYHSNITSYAYQASSGSDEIGLIFRAPFRCKVNGVWVVLGTNNANADATLRIYSSPTGTPSIVDGNFVNVLGEQGNNTTTGRARFIAFPETTLEANTDYCVALEATGTSTINLMYATVAAAHRNAMGLANCRAGSRDQSGNPAFTETTTEIPFIALQISALDDGQGQARAVHNMGVF